MGPVRCYPGRATIRSTLRVHSLHRHLQDTVVILEEGSHPLPRCPKCDIFITWMALNFKHQSMDICTREEERRQKRRSYKEAWKITVVYFQVYRRPLVVVSEFKYLRRVLTDLDEN